MKNEVLDTKSMNLLEKIMRISTEMGCVKKEAVLNGRNGEALYSALSIDSIMTAVKVLEAKYRIWSYGGNKTVTRSSRQQQKTNYETGENYTLILNSVYVNEEFHFVNIDNPADEIVIQSFGAAEDYRDKAVSKALTNADKNAYIRMYKIVGENDTIAEEGTEYTQDASAVKEKEVEFTAEKEAPEEAKEEATEALPAAEAAAIEETPAAETACAEPIAIDAEDAPKDRFDPFHGVTIPETVEEAMAFVVPNGKHKGRTMGEINALDPHTIEWYAGEKYAKNAFANPALKASAKLIAEANAKSPH